METSPPPLLLAPRPLRRVPPRLLLFLLLFLGTPFGCRPEDPAAGEPTARSVTAAPDDLELDRAAPEAVRRARLPLLARAVREGVDPAQATITFSEPLSAADLLEILEVYDLRPRRLSLLTMGEDGLLASGTLALDVPPGPRLGATLETGLEDVTRRGGEFLGISALVGAVPADQLEPLQDDPRVFLVDLSADPSLGGNRREEESAHDLGWRLWQSRAGAAGPDAEPGEPEPPIH